MDDESGGKRKGSPGKEVEVVWASDEKIMSTICLCRKGQWKFKVQGRRKRG